MIMLLWLTSQNMALFVDMGLGMSPLRKDLFIVNKCGRINDIDESPTFNSKGKIILNLNRFSTENSVVTFRTISQTSSVEKDPIKMFQSILHHSLFGHRGDDYDVKASGKLVLLTSQSEDLDPFAHYPSGQIMRADLFQNQSVVHLPMSEYLHNGHCYLKITRDYMQTAINAFAIMLEGDLNDVLRLPPSYVLRSARTIAMMRIPREKLVATWTVVKAGNRTEDITYQTLEMYRPLFKYLNGREMARLNLSDERILKFIGTHADLDRHQVGVVANKYISLNPKWREPKYLNLMNNLLCGVPMTFMRRVPENTYLQLTHQAFYHIRACDPLQRRFYLAMMTRTQAIGKSFSWSARDVSRLGLLLSEVDGSDLSAVNPEAMNGITSQVMLEIPPHTLKHITEKQLRYIQQKPLNILARKLKNFQEQQHSVYNSGYRNMPPLVYYLHIWIILHLWRFLC